MDDFLHNLRSGKLKSDRSNRQYGDQQFKGGQRRNVNDRRKGGTPHTHHDNKEATERLNAIKEVLETLAETQKTMAQAYQERTRAEERKAIALEVLAKNIYRLVNPKAQDADNLFSESAVEHASIQMPKEVHTANTQEQLEENTEEEDQYTTRERLSDDDRDALQVLIGEMREGGNSWEYIARHIASKGYPTISGKGNWRGVMVKNLYERMSE